MSHCHASRTWTMNTQRAPWQSPQWTWSLILSQPLSSRDGVGLPMLYHSPSLLPNTQTSLVSTHYAAKQKAATFWHVQRLDLAQWQRNSLRLERDQLQASQGIINVLKSNRQFIEGVVYTATRHWYLSLTLITVFKFFFQCSNMNAYRHSDECTIKRNTIVFILVFFKT